MKVRHSSRVVLYALVATLAVTLAAAPSAEAVTKYWIGSPANSGNDAPWLTAANWSTGAVPTASDVAVIGSTTGSVPVGTTSVAASTTGATGNITIGDTAVDCGTVNVNGTLTVSSTNLLIGNNGVGTINVNAGGIFTSSLTSSTTHVKLGAAGTGIGIVNINGGTFNVYRANGTLSLGYAAGTGAAGYINETSGLCSDCGAFSIYRGAYVLGGGALNTLGIASVGNTYSSGAFTQTGGTYTFYNGLNVGISGGTGAYTFTGGSLLGWQLNSYVSPFFSINVGAAGSHGMFYMGNASGTGTIGLTGTGVRGIGMTIRADSAATGLFRGWGVVGLDCGLVNNGQVIADGYGTDRLLDMSGLVSLFATSNATESFANTGGSGWFARNHGELLLPSLSMTATNNFFWGGSLNDLVNSVSVNVTTLNNPGSLSIALLSPDRADIPTGLVNPIGVWSFTQNGGLSIGSADLAFRYDDNLATALNIPVTSLDLYHWNGASWDYVPTTQDLANSRLTATGVTSFSDYAIAEGLASTPEPATLALLGTGCLAAFGFVRRRMMK